LDFILVLFFDQRIFFRPCGAWFVFNFYPRLKPWAIAGRRSATNRVGRVTPCAPFVGLPQSSAIVVVADSEKWFNLTA